MPRSAPHTRYDYKSGTTTKDWLGQARADAVADSATGLTSASAIALLASAAVNLNEGTAAKQPLYTVPAGKKLVIDHYVFREPSAAVTTADGTSGFNAAANNLAGSFTSLVGLTGIDTAITVPSSAMNPGVLMGQTGEVLGFAVSTPEGSVLTATVDVFGYLIAA